MSKEKFCNKLEYNVTTWTIVHYIKSTLQEMGLSDQMLHTTVALPKTENYTYCCSSVAKEIVPFRILHESSSFYKKSAQTDSEV